jgi:hypothetical protein
MLMTIDMRGVFPIDPSEFLKLRLADLMKLSSQPRMVEEHSIFTPG